MSGELPVLLGCPFCGGRARFNRVDEEENENFSGEYIDCEQCQASTFITFPLMEDVKEKLAEQWNRRVGADGVAKVPPIIVQDIEDLCQVVTLENGRGAVRFAVDTGHVVTIECISRRHGDLIASAIGVGILSSKVETK